MTNFEQEMINVLEQHVEAEMNGDLELTMAIGSNEIDILV